MNRHELERLRRSVVMLSPGQQARWTREQVLNLIEALMACEARHPSAAG